MQKIPFKTFVPINEQPKPQASEEQIKWLSERWLPGACHN